MTFTPREEYALQILESLVKKSPRQCGGCTLCCTALEVKDLVPPKPMDEKCTHLDGSCTSCTIYKQRPDTCRAFYCVWMMTPIFKGMYTPEDLYPARCGFVLSWEPITSPRLMTLFKDPDRPNEWTKYKRVLEQIARHHNVAIGIGGGHTATHIVTPKRHWFAKTDYPEFFNGSSVGVPRDEFL